LANPENVRHSRYRSLKMRTQNKVNSG